MNKIQINKTIKSRSLNSEFCPPRINKSTLLYPQLLTSVVLFSRWKQEEVIFPSEVLLTLQPSGCTLQCWGSQNPSSPHNQTHLMAPGNHFPMYTSETEAPSPSSFLPFAGIPRFLVGYHTRNSLSKESLSFLNQNLFFSF